MTYLGLITLVVLLIVSGGSEASEKEVINEQEAVDLIFNCFEFKKQQSGEITSHQLFAECVVEVEETYDIVEL